jgi:glycosyltransferase involved in cell wall biosynthesis
VTLAIPCYNAASTLESVLDGVARLSPKPDDLLVVDDGSTDGSAELARHLGARVVEHGQNQGVSAARNTALEQSTSDIVLFIDADTVPHRDLVRHLTAGYEDPHLAGIGGQVLESHTAGLANVWRCHFWRQTQGDRQLDRAPYVIGACFSLRRQAALDAGGFSSTFHTNGEDVELSIRLRHGGLRLMYRPRAQVRHLRRDNLTSLLAMIYRHQRDHVRALQHHDEPCYPVVHNALRWGPVTLLSSLHRHRSATLAALSPLCYGASLAGCISGLSRRG